MGKNGLRKYLENPLVHVWKKSSCKWLVKNVKRFPNSRALLGEPSKAQVRKVAACKARAAKVPQTLKSLYNVLNVYVCICMYMYVYVCICMYMYVYVCLCMFMYI